MEAATPDAKLHYRLEGGEGGHPVTLSHSLGSHLGIWDAQVSALGARRPILRYDVRGHGRSEVPEGPYALDDLAGDAVGLLDSLHIDRTHFVGISMGGMIGQLLALEHSERLQSLVLCDTTSEIPRAMRPVWDERIRITEEQGMGPHVEPTMQRWFTEGFRRSHPEEVERIARMVRSTDPRGYVACCGAIRELDLTDRLREIAVPTLIVVGAEDAGTSPDVARAIHERIERSELVVLDSAAHLCNVEQAKRFNEVVGDFLDRHEPGAGGR